MTMYRRRLLCLILVLSMIITLVPAATGSNTAARAASVRKGITLMDKVNVRYGAGTNEKIIFSLPANHVCDILEVKTVQKVRWYRVETIDPSRKNSNKYRGYIHGDYFRELSAEEVAQYDNGGTVTAATSSSDSGGNKTTTTTSSGKNQDLPAKAGSIGSVTAGGTNLREGPGTGYHSITRLDRNTQVELLTIPSVRGSGSNTFFKVKYNGNVGYIMSDFISILIHCHCTGNCSIFILDQADCFHVQIIDNIPAFHIILNSFCHCDPGGAICTRTEHIIILNRIAVIFFDVYLKFYSHI